MTAGRWPRVDLSPAGLPPTFKGHFFSYLLLVKEAECERESRAKKHCLRAPKWACHSFSTAFNEASSCVLLSAQL